MKEQFYAIVSVLSWFAILGAVGGVEANTMTIPTAFLISTIAFAVGLFGVYKLGAFKSKED